MPTVYLTEQYSTVRKDGESLLIIPPKSAERGQKQRVPLIKIEDVMVMGDVTLTSRALRALLEQKVSVSHLSRWGGFIGHTSSGFTKNSLLRVSQFRAHLNEDERLEIARNFVLGKLTNLRVLLMRYQRSRGLPEIENAIAMTDTALKGAARVDALDQLMGHEGVGSAAYFGVFGHLLLDGWEFSGRNRRPPTDPVNALLSYGYSILTGKMTSVLHSVGFDPYVGYLHVPHYGRPALALDLMEEFRPIIVDSVVLRTINSGSLRPEHVEDVFGSFRLTNEGRKIFLTAFEDRMNDEITHPVFKYHTTYKRCLELQARILGKALTGEISEYIPFEVR